MAKQSKRLIYIGPNLSRGRLLQYQVFIGGLPEHLDAEFDEFPQLKQLFVSVEQLNEAVEAARKAGTPLNKYYKQAMEV